MAKQTINLGTSPNKGDGDPLRTAFDKVNDNFDELYVDIKQIKSAQTGGGTLIVDTIGSVHATDSTLLLTVTTVKLQVLYLVQHGTLLTTILKLQQQTQV